MRARDYLLSVGELTTNHQWENRLPIEQNGAYRPNDFPPRLQRAFQRHEFAPRRELMETRRGVVPYALIKRNARARKRPLYPSPSPRCVLRGAFGIKRDSP